MYTYIERARIKKASDPSYYDEVRAKVRDSLTPLVGEDLAVRIEEQLFTVVSYSFHLHSPMV
jgi:hypothetical protein